MHHQILRFAAFSLLPLVALTGACLSEDDPKGPASAVAPPGDGLPPGNPDTLDGAFVPISREGGATTAPRRLGALNKAEASGVEQDFYLAISKKELGSRWFLSTYMSQSDFGLFAWPLGTAVVSFKVQNGKLFMFRAEEGLETSEVLKPEFVMEAYPLVTGVKSFDSKTNSGDYLLFDPAAGYNRFTILGESSFPVNISLVFSQKFRKISDGYTFEQVWTGTDADPAAGGEKLSGTLALALRRYKEGAGFVPMVLGKGPAHFFSSRPHLVKDEGRVIQYARKWNIGPKNPPIVWAISPLTEKVNKDPQYAQYDLVGAIKAGIEGWNQVFGFRALEARLAKDNEVYGADDVNMIVFDTDKTAGAAFGPSRYNPNTGEILGASIYFPLAFLVEAAPPTGSTPPAPTVSLPPGALGPDGKESVRRSFAWGDSEPEEACGMGIRPLDELIEGAKLEMAKGMSGKEVVERYITEVVMHEVGHTLGLRHNFKGSVHPPSSSTMDYLGMEAAVALAGTPGSYDVAAIRKLYGMSDVAPADPFCTDDQETLDPDCRMFDQGATPLTDYFIPFHGMVTDMFLAGALPLERAVYLDRIVPHVRGASDPATRVVAYEAAMAPVRKPVGPKVKAAVRDSLTLQIFERLFVRPLPTRSPLPKELVAAKRPIEPVVAAAVVDLKAFLIDADGSRSMPVRRASADVLKLFQHASAAAVLKEARDVVAAKLPMLTGNLQIETMDLLGRIDRHLAAYFN